MWGQRRSRAGKPRRWTFCVVASNARRVLRASDTSLYLGGSEREQVLWRTKEHLHMLKYLEDWRHFELTSETTLHWLSPKKEGMADQGSVEVTDSMEHEFPLNIEKEKSIMERLVSQLLSENSPRKVHMSDMREKLGSFYSCTMTWWKNELSR